ncbi:MAG: sigma-70 family RNA polymerase sigma factor [Lentimicrobium sp.]|nr:sigma-70 family RNA polymerase sigma factor [Lentimicrobium sp.]
MDHDALLVEGCKAGNQQALIGVYKKYNHMIYNTCLRIVCVSADAEDLMQNSFIDAFNRIKTYKGPSAFAGWLKKIAVNNSIDYLAKRRPVVEKLELLPEISDYDDAAEEEFIEYRVELIKKALEIIIPEYRLILALHLFEGYDHEEIGQILKISQANVRTRMSRAKKALLKEIGHLQHQQVTADSSSYNERRQK